jgi:hypothetical protein
VTAELAIFEGILHCWSDFGDECDEISAKATVYRHSRGLEWRVTFIGLCEGYANERMVFYVR